MKKVPYLLLCNKLTDPKAICNILKSSLSSTMMLSMLGTNFRRKHFQIFFSFFPSNQILTAHANCRMGDNLYEISKPVSLENKKKYFKILSAENFTQHAKR